MFMRNEDGLDNTIEEDSYIRQILAVKVGHRKFGRKMRPKKTKSKNVNVG